MLFMEKSKRFHQQLLKPSYIINDQKPIEEIGLALAMQYHNDGHFIKGSMGPKMGAGISFVKETQGVTIITNSENALAAIQGKSRTKIVP